MVMAAAVAVPRKNVAALFDAGDGCAWCVKQLTARSTVLHYLYRSSSKPGGRPPCEPLCRRAAWLSAFSGMGAECHGVAGTRGEGALL
jgi:hypothetical protein